MADSGISGRCNPQASPSPGILLEFNRFACLLFEGYIGVGDQNYARVGERRINL